MIMYNKSTDKINLQYIARICALKGMRHVVISPGSRNAPLIIAFNRESSIRTHVIVDERSAAYFALGMAQQTGEPVGVICTSGTALLNYAPAVAEAYYQRVPLLVISADRPAEWIDQDDSQTIRQPGALAQVVKCSYQLPVESTQKDDVWYVNRCVNDAINCMMSDRKGPVHLNIPLSEPLCGLADKIVEEPRVFDKISGGSALSPEDLGMLSERIAASSAVMILASMHSPSQALENALSALSRHENVIVLTETVSNLKNPSFINNIDRNLCRMTDGNKERLMPELLISFGGPLISKFLKTRFKDNPPVEHWYIGVEDHAIDTFCHLSRQLDISPERFFSALGPLVRNNPDASYKKEWMELEAYSDMRHRDFIADLPWSDLKAFSRIIPSLPTGSRLQLSNGTCVRYHQLFKGCNVSQVNSNRGTSGIDGSTSTAAGASAVFDGVTTLITGDISFLYDSNGLWNRKLSPNLKIIVMNNGGGGIFRFIKGPSDVEELEEFFETPHGLDFSKIAALYSLDYFSAENEEELEAALPLLYESPRPAILDVKTPNDLNAQILRAYFK